jgi:hypothetical protein
MKKIAEKDVTFSIVCVFLLLILCWKQRSRSIFDSFYKTRQLGMSTFVYDSETRAMIKAIWCLKMFFDEFGNVFEFWMLGIVR